MTILRIDSSVNTQTSVTRDLTDRIITALGGSDPVIRDLAASPLPHITESWAAARLVPADERTAAQADVLALSDTLIDEVKAADTLVIGLPIYNFSVPSALKAWIDLMARPGVTFRYGASGPEGLLTGKRAIIALASGGTAMGSDIDFASGYLRHFLGFIGITQVQIIAADGLGRDAEATLTRAHEAIAALPAAG